MRPFLAMAALALGAACSTSKTTPPAAGSAKVTPVGKRIALKTARGLPAAPAPADNPPTAETIELGEKLFFSTLLSKDRSISCASCHVPGAAFSDPRPSSVGVGGKTGNRNAPPAQNAAFNTAQFWDGRAATLEEQALGPIQNPVEMALSLEELESRLNADEGMKQLFAKAFHAPATRDGVAKALAAYERTLVAGDSAFDRYQFGGDKKALSESARRGLDIFQDPKKGNCAVCHTIEKDHALFTDNKFHNIGVGFDAEGKLLDQGRFEVTRKEEDRGAFKTPGLRNVAKTAPYMHDGSLRTLKDVVDHYVGGGTANPQLDKEMKALSHLTKQDRADLVAFLEALTTLEPTK